MSLLLISTASIWLVSILYNLYDLKFPSHFVGDMYGYEVIFRVIVLAAVSAIFLAGVACLHFAKAANSSYKFALGTFFCLTASIISLFMGMSVFHGRQLDETRKTYFNLNNENLLKIIRNKRDRYAIHPIFVKNDSETLPTLSKILMDESIDLHCRCEAAHFLGQLNDGEAKKALQYAITSQKDEELHVAINRAIEAIDGRSQQTTPDHGPVTLH